MVEFGTDIKAARKSLDFLLAKRQVLSEKLAADKQKLGIEENKLLATEKARAIAQQVATDLQKDLECQISNIVTMALASVSFDYEFKVSFVEKRNQTECEMVFVRDGNECDPMDSSGGGAIDIASIALRMAIWSIKKTRAIQILDEPAKFLSRDMQEKCSELIKMLSAELGIQMIIVSHIPEMITAADRIINVENKQGYSIVKEI